LLSAAGKAYWKALCRSWKALTKGGLRREGLPLEGRMEDRMERNPELHEGRGREARGRSEEVAFAYQRG
jgi:hypothetical protein